MDRLTRTPVSKGLNILSLFSEQRAGIGAPFAFKAKALGMRAFAIPRWESKVNLV
jgi:hypothetical protein